MARDIFSYSPLKLSLLESIESNQRDQNIVQPSVSLYLSAGGFIDLCTGPHILQYPVEHRLRQMSPSGERFTPVPILSLPVLAALGQSVNLHHTQHQLPLHLDSQRLHQFLVDQIESVPKRAKKSLQILSNSQIGEFSLELLSLSASQHHCHTKYLQTAPAAPNDSTTTLTVQRVCARTLYNPNARGERSMSDLLQQWSALQESIQRRDHRQIGQRLQLFFFSPLSPGCPVFLPHGNRIILTLQTWLRQLYRSVFLFGRVFFTALSLTHTHTHWPMQTTWL